MNDLKVGDQVRYFKGAKEPLVGKTGVIKSIFAPDARGYREAMVQFETGSYPCWCGNLEKV